MTYDPKLGPPNPEDAKEKPVKITRTTQWDCYNLYPGIYWHNETPGSKHGPCIHYDDSEYQQQLAEYEAFQEEQES